MPGPVRLEHASLASVLPANSHVFISGCSAESDLFATEIEAAGAALGKAVFSGIFIPGVNRQAWTAGPESRAVTFFQSPAFRRAGTRFLPLCYQDVANWYAANPPDGVMLMLAPPDEDGMCSLGADCGFGGDLWDKAGIRIAHINPLMPRTRGHEGIPFDALTAYYDVSQPLRSMAQGNNDACSAAIAAHASRFVDDGSSLQCGLGKLPDAILDVLHDRRDLRLHSGLAGDGALRLVRSGAMADGASVLVGCAIGSESLYQSISEEAFQFRPVSVTHDRKRIAAISRFVAINSVMSVDLFGQGYAESSSRGFLSGPGGATDFAVGARASEGGLRLIVLPSAAGDTSRIAAPGDTFGPVSLSRFDIDVVVTEHGAADLRGLDHDQRARALISIAQPEHREMLARAWAPIAANL